MSRGQLKAADHVTLYIRMPTVENAGAMPKQTETREAQVRYWRHRLRSRAFKRELTALLRRELAVLAGERVKDVVDPKLIRSMIGDWNARMIDRRVLADLVIETGRRAGRQRSGAPLGTPLRRVLDPHLIADIDALVEEGFALSAETEEFVAAIMRQDLVRGLFTDIIFSAIVSFYRRVNPLFGAITMRVLEEQIKGFIRFFMPMLQRQAIAFILDPANQRVAADFARVIVQHLLDQPLPNGWAELAPGQRRRMEALIRHAAGSAKLDAVIRDATLAVWDDLYAMIRNKRVGDLVRIDAQAAWFAERCVEVILPALSRPHLMEFLAAEMARAASPAGQAG
ncbi:MAG TPA: hypothetical protein VMW56_03935 [Candidatus Margulisiibacteriota bacterium]|nr:hypothetical protein [Candidatus Margulisiibacteriota bacterium]